jgi:hypothetical protein
MAGGCLAAELLLGYLLWLREHQRSSLQYTIDGIATALRQLRTPWPTNHVVVRYDPDPMFVPDPYLGYISRPGRYTVSMTEPSGNRRHTFNVTIDSDGCRITSPAPETFHGKPEIWIFGDSFVKGWGNEDESTFPFLLQRYLPDRRVVNFSENGYGTIHAYLQLRRKLDRSARPPEIIVIAYADYFNERNVAAHRRLRSFRVDTAPGWRTQDPSRFTHPRARLAGDQLTVDYVPLLASEPRAPFEKPVTPTRRDQYAVTCRLMQEIHALGTAHGARMIVAYLQGDDGDPVVACSAGAGYVMADLRADFDQREWDDFQPLDPHPGPRAQSIYAWKLFRRLNSDIVSPPTATTTAAPPPPPRASGP